MRKINHDEVGIPGVCFLCEQAPTEQDEVVDTERDYLDPEDILTGRKYVCSRCIHEAADLLGYVHEDTFKWELVQLEQELVKMREFQSQVEALMNPDKGGKRIALA